MKLFSITEDIRYNSENKEVYKISTIILDAIINRVPTVNCHIYSATDDTCEVMIKHGEYYNQSLRRRVWKFTMKLKISLSKKSIHIVGTNIRFEFGPDAADQVATTIHKYILIS